MWDENFRDPGVGVIKHILYPPVVALRLGWIVGGVDKPIVLLCPTRVEASTHDKFFIFVKIEDANGGGIVFSSWKMGVTDKSAIGGEALGIVTIGPVEDMRIVSETPDAKVIAGAENTTFCAWRGREKVSAKKNK